MTAVESAGSDARSWPRRHRRALLLAAAAILIALVAIGAVSWHFSSAVVVPDHSDWPTDITVEDVSAKRIVLSPSGDMSRPGVYGLEWQGGRAVVGEVIDRRGDLVTRRLRTVDGYLVPGMKVAWNSGIYAGDPGAALGLPFSDVRVPGELGPLPAWLVPGRSRTWAIVVHGINATPELGLRIVPVLHRLDLVSLLITYRDDLGAPPSPDGLHHMGLTEWRDLQSAARFALDRGAERLVLVGYSMGGSIVTQFMERSRLAPHVSGIVLDAPALDWKSVISHNATEMGFPAFSTLPVRWSIGARIDADWDRLDALQHTEDFHLPVLLFHGADDSVVPISDSEAFADELPRWVSYFRVADAEHVASWNVDPRLYERRLAKFLTGIGAAGRASPAPSTRDSAPEEKSPAAPSRSQP